MIDPKFLSKLQFLRVDLNPSSPCRLCNLYEELFSYEELFLDFPSVDTPNLSKINYETKLFWKQLMQFGEKLHN